MARVLITGVAGFIGSSIARALISQGASVCGLDDLSTGHLENIEDIAEAMDFIQGSVEDRDTVRRACDGADYVFHEAALPSVPLSIGDPLGTHDRNLGGTLALLEAARQAGVKRLMYAASSAVYGSDAPDLPKTEAMLPAPISPYAVQKVAGEYYLATYARVYGLETVALRYFNIFGPRQDPSSQYSGVLARFIAQMSGGTKPTIFGDGSASRDFTHVDNVVSANLLAAKAPSYISGKVFNVATGHRVTLLQAYEAVSRLTGYEGTPSFLPARTGDILHSYADITRAEQMLGYRVVTSFMDGLCQTVDWHQRRTGTPVTPMCYSPSSQVHTSLSNIAFA